MNEQKIREDRLAERLASKEKSHHERSVVSSDVRGGSLRRLSFHSPIRLPLSTQRLPLLLLLLLSLLPPCHSIILSGAPDAYARYPKWAHSFENSLSLELKTRQTDGLILYTDDGGVHGNFYCLTISDGRIQLDFRLGDSSSDEAQRRPVNTIRVDEVRVDDDRWHTLTLFQSWENVKLELDYTLVFKILNQRSFVFGNLLKNSDVYVGGLPMDLHLLPTMSSPLRRYTRHLAGNVRNLVYRLYPQGVTSPQVIDSFGVRNNEDDFCRVTGATGREVLSCKNDGRCYNTNDGPKCDCTESDHEGGFCEIEKPAAELHFSGGEWVGYDVSPFPAGPVRSHSESVRLSFKTVHGTALLFFSGDETSYLHLAIEDGAVIATSKFAGTDARVIRMFNTYPGERYDDDGWHEVTLHRTLQMMTMSVDGRKDEIRQYAPETDWLRHSFAYLGGLPRNRTHPAVSRTSFRGCMRKAKYSADAHHIVFLNVADQGYGDSIIRTGGELSFSCRNPSQPADVLSFNSGRDHITLPKWNAMASGSLSFLFRTSSPDGLLLYHGTPVTPSSNTSDYIAFELIDGHLFMVIDLGSGPVRLQTTARRVTDGSECHSVSLERVGRGGRVVVDSIRTDFSTPGVSANLIVDDPVYLGYVPPATTRYPSTVWSIALRKGFQGCIKNVRFNGISAKIATAFEEQNVTGIALGCPLPVTADMCEPNPCQNFGRCEARHNSFTCDCSATQMTGPTCSIEPVALSLENLSIVHVLSTAVASEAESIEIRFRSEHSRGALLDSKSLSHPTHRLAVTLEEGKLRVQIVGGGGNHSFHWGSDLSDGRWHLARIKRRGEKLLLYVDGKWEHSFVLPSDLVVFLDELSAGHSLHGEKRGETAFRGQISSLVYNDVDLLKQARREHGGRTGKDKGQRNVKAKQSSVSFGNATGFVSFAPAKIASLHGGFRVSFKMQTLAKSGLLWSMSGARGEGDYAMLELWNGRVRYTFSCSGREERLVSPAKGVNDMRWHTVMVYQDASTLDHYLLVDNTSSVLPGKRGERMEMSGFVHIGGVPPSSPLPGRLSTARGFRGCIGALKMGEDTIAIPDDATTVQGAMKGCPGPIARCSPTACENGGKCIQQWDSIKCDCSLTGHSGSRCQEAGTSFTFPATPSAIYYEYPPAERPSTEKDFLVLSFSTREPQGVLFSVECAADQDYLTLFIERGFLQLKYNLGSRDHHVGFYQQRVDDGETHTVKMLRGDANVTLALDKQPVIKYRPQGLSELVTLNMHWRLVVGSAFNLRHNEMLSRRRRSRRRRGHADPTLYDPYQGSISGVNFNGMMLLDLAATGHPNVRTVGQPAKSHQSSSPPEKMNDIHSPVSEALIESIGPGCLSIEEQEQCFIDTEATGFFTPVLPSVAPTPRRVTPTASSSKTGESTTSTSSTTTASTTTSTMSTSSAVYLKELTEEIEGSAEIPLQLTPATTPATTTTTVKTTSTVLPRPYNSVSEAAELNPEYLGDSIWNEAEELPEPALTGPAWVTHLTKPATTPMTTTVETTKPATTALTRRVKTTRKKTTTSTTTTTTVATTTTERWTATPIGKKHRITHPTTPRPQKTRTAPPFTVYAVRPTTPMGALATTTMKTPEQADFPRTALISIASVSVILVIAVVVFCVFRCRQNPPPGEHYPVMSSGKSAPSGYAPISADLSPPMTHDPTVPLIAPRPQVNGNGYQPLKGSVLPNGNGAASNGRANPAKKKDFKEWYV